MPRRIGCSALIAFAVLLGGANAEGKPAAPRRATPETVADIVRRSVAAGEAAEQRREWERALASYEEALAAGPSLAASQGVARAHFELGHDVAAFDAYTFLASALTEPTLGRERVSERLGLLAARIGVVVLTVTTPDADVDLDGQRIGHAPLQLVSVRVTSGKHTIKVTAAAGTVERAVDVGPGSTEAIRIPSEPKPPEPPVPAAPTPAAVPAPAPAAAVEGEAWQVAHGSRHYAAARTDARPDIDGTLAERIWQTAPRDSNFFSLKSKPYGAPTSEPTTVQVAYDDENLYVAVRCAYAAKRPRDDTFSTDEEGMLDEAETFSVIVDPQHTHTNAFLFAVARVGTRADIELSDGGSNVNMDWRGIWDVATRRDADGWTAEFRIPWGTMRMPRPAGPVTVGLNFRRKEPQSGESALWSLHPPATFAFDVNFFGHLDGLVDVRPSQRLYLQPYVAVAYDQTSGRNSFLNDMTGTNREVRAFGGLYARYQPPGPVRFDGTFNPNFSGVTPDRALANFDRFELEFPEVRPFFAEDVQRFQLGGKLYEPFRDDPGTQLFYSRRIGLRTTTAGLTEVVPVLYGVKSVLRAGGTEAAVMNVGLAPNTPRLVMDDTIGIARVSQTFDEGRRIGFLGLARTGDAGRYVGGGVDGTLTFLDRHVALSGFLAQTASDQSRRSGAGQLTLEMNAQDFYARASHTDVGTAFDAQLGFFPLTGARTEVFAAGYTPVVKNDLLQQVFLDAQITLARDRAETRIFDRGIVGAAVSTPSGGFFQVEVEPGIEQVARDFTLANERVQVLAGRYDVMVLKLYATTAPRRPVVARVGYLTGDLFAGTRRAPSLTIGLNLGRFTSSVLYRLFLVRYGESSLTEHQVSATAGYAFTPLAKSTLVIETNTLQGTALAQFITSYTFGALSTVALVVRGTSGSTVQEVARDWYDRPNISGILSFALGLSPF